MDAQLMEWNKFSNLPIESVRQIVCNSGPHNCVIPINGTRRWFMLEHADMLRKSDSLDKAYLEIVTKQYMKLVGMFFMHGVSTLLLPFFGPELLTRGDDYAQMAMNGLKMLATDPEMVRFYVENEVAVRFYGDYEAALTGTKFESIIENFRELSTVTEKYTKHRLFIGVFANDATERVAKIAVKFNEKFQRVPNREEIIFAYYGDSMRPIDMFIGFDRFATFDMPLLATGEEALYFTVAPTFYFGVQTLRKILYDYIFSRNVNTDYTHLQPAEWQRMRDFYSANLTNVQGVGKTSNGIWYPTPQIARI